MSTNTNPAAASRPTIDALADGLAEALRRPDVQELLRSALTPAPATPTPAGLDKLLSLRETADVLGVSVRSLSRVRADPDSGFPSPTMVGALPRWPRAAIADWAERRALQSSRCRRGRR